MKSNKAKRDFTRFTANDALRDLQVRELVRWEIESRPFQTGSYWKERLRRLESFDLSHTPQAKALLTDAFCDEALRSCTGLKIWKDAPLQSDELRGRVDYLAAPKMAYVTQPLLCIAEARKDDFETGLAQCLMSMKVASWINEQAGNAIDLYGCVTNNSVWVFYKYTVGGEVHQTLPHSIANQERVLSVLSQVFMMCEANIVPFHAKAKAA